MEVWLRGVSGQLLFRWIAPTNDGVYKDQLCLADGCFSGGPHELDHYELARVNHSYTTPPVASYHNLPFTFQPTITTAAKKRLFIIALQGLLTWTCPSLPSDFFRFGFD